MANIEGAWRMVRAGRLLVQAGMGAIFLAAVGFVVGSRISGFSMMPAFVILLVYFGILPSLGGIVLWVAGWIVEGFLQPGGRE